MSDPKYKNIGSASIKLIEECGELIQAVCKGERFGWDNYHPDRPNSTNVQELCDEMRDVKTAFDILLKEAFEDKSVKEKV